MLRRPDIALAGCLLLFALCASLAPSPVEASERTAEVNVKGARVRSGPGTDHTIVGSFGKGTRFEVVGESGSWLQVVLPDGGRGWIYRKIVVLHEGGGKAKKGFLGSALSTVKKGFGKGKDTARATGGKVLALGESQSSAGGRMLDDVEREDARLQKKGELLVNYAAVDRMDRATAISPSEMNAFIRQGGLSPEERP